MHELSGVPHAVDEVLDQIIGTTVPTALNIYVEGPCVEAGDEQGAATRRREALRHYLAEHWEAPVVLVGEAPGKDGARRTGIPFTSPGQLTGSGANEPTARAMQRALLRLGREADVLLWNVSFLFPPGNRDPLRSEVRACSGVLEAISRGRAVFAIGRHAQRATGAPYIRHPSHGGVARFNEGLIAALWSLPATGGVPALERPGRASLG